MCKETSLGTWPSLGVGGRRKNSEKLLQVLIFWYVVQELQHANQIICVTWDWSQECYNCRHEYVISNEKEMRKMTVYNNHSLSNYDTLL